MNTAMIMLRRNLLLVVCALACTLCVGFSTASAQDDSYDINVSGLEDSEGGGETITVQFADPSDDDNDGGGELLEATHAFVGNGCNAGFAVPAGKAVQAVVFRGQIIPIACGAIIVRVGLGCYILKVCRIGRIVIITLTYYRWCPC